MDCSSRQPKETNISQYFELVQAVVVVVFDDDDGGSVDGKCGRTWWLGSYSSSPTSHLMLQGPGTATSESRGYITPAFHRRRHYKKLCVWKTGQNVRVRVPNTLHHLLHHRFMQRPHDFLRGNEVQIAISARITHLYTTETLVPYRLVRFQALLRTNRWQVAKRGFGVRRDANLF